MLERWPSLPWQEWQDTANTLHMWMQIVGKTKLALTPLRNHWWNVTFQLSARGLTTGSIPYNNESFEIQFDFLEHRLLIATSAGQVESLPLRPQSVADFYQEYLAFLHRLAIDVKIWAMPVEIPDPIPFAEDRKHAS